MFNVVHAENYFMNFLFNKILNVATLFQMSEHIFEYLSRNVYNMRRIKENPTMKIIVKRKKNYYFFLKRKAKNNIKRKEKVTSKEKFIELEKNVVFLHFTIPLANDITFPPCFTTK